MESEISSVSSRQAAPAAPAGTTVSFGPEQAKVQKAPVQMPERPKVAAPKPVEVKYDPNEARANLSSAIKMLNEQMTSTQRGLGFSYDDSKKAAVIKVTDTNSGAVVRQIPTEEVLKMAHHIDAMKGILYNKIA